MRALRFLNLMVVFFLVATCVAVYSQDRREDAKPAPEQASPDTQDRQDQMKPERQDEAKPPKQDKQEEKQDKKELKQQDKQSREMKQGNTDAMQSGNHARPAGKSGHIPDDKFRSNFGRSHTFVVQRTVMVQGQPGFVYGGYSFVFVDPWPVGWAYTDDCYVDYIDGDYFLFDLLHPGVRIALFVVL